MKICFFGGYDKEYNRNVILEKGLKENNVKIINCYINRSKYNPVILKDLPFFIFSTFWRYLKLIKKHFGNKYDILFVPFPAFYDLPLAYILSKIKNKPLVHDIFISKYESLVIDRKCVNKNSFRAKLFKFYDKISSSLPDLCLLDTNEHIKYFKNFLKIDSMFYRVLVGSPAKYKKFENNNKNFTVLFYGNYIPLHGIEHIIHAAEILKNHKEITFKLIGTGQTYDQMISLYKKLKINNINFTNNISYDKLINNILKSDICLGIFSNNIKSKIVVPNKIYDYLALKKPFITSSTKAINEVGIKDNVHAILCDAANPKSISNSILYLKNNPEYRNKIASNGHDLFLNNFTPKIIGNNLKNHLNFLFKLTKSGKKF